jgi:hypothetical protein
MKLGDHVTQYMERSIRENDFVLIVCTPLYKQKSDSRLGGVGYEGHIITGEIYSKANHQKFIPILREGIWEAAAPTYLISKYYCDLRDSQFKDQNYKRLVQTLRGKAPSAPPVQMEVHTSRNRSAGPNFSPRIPEQRFSSRPEIVGGDAVLRELRRQLRTTLEEREDSIGHIVFVDLQGLQRVKIYVYQTHCKVRIRCSRDWGFRQCTHRKNHRNSGGWLDALRVDDRATIREVLDLYDLEWGACVS